MLRPSSFTNSRGFTLVEVLVVMVIMGLVVTSVYSQFISNKRSSATTEEVVDVQQNLRVALETLAADIRMAGFLIPEGDDPITSAPDVLGIDGNRDNDLDDAGDSGAFFTLQTGSSVRTYARVLSESFTSPTVSLVVENDMLDNFNDTHEIRVIRPSTRTDLSGENWDISVDDSTSTISATDTSSGGTYTSGTIEAGDMIIRKQSGEGYPAVVSYWLRPTENAGTNNFELVRRDDSGTSVVASYISAMDLAYLMEDGTESAAPANTDEIKAVRIDITAQTDNTKTGSADYSGTKTRRLQTLVKIQNVMGE